MPIVVFYFIYTYLLLLNNEKDLVFGVHKLCLNSYIMLSFGYLEVVRGLLDDTIEQPPILSIPTH